MHDHATRTFRRARLFAASAALGAAAALAACGSSSPTRSTAATGSGANAASSALAFSKCMRANGVPNFPDLGSNGTLLLGNGNGQTVSVNGVSVDAPAYRAARTRCQRYMLTHTAASASQQAQQIAAGLKFARCMRSHGVPSFPDPKVISSSGGNQQVELPGVNTQSPAFQAAAKACGGGPKGS
jgi:hypothetical protein